MGYVTRHTARDAELPRRREELLTKALDDLTGDPDVLAIYLGGSLAKGNYDTYSDIDLHTIVDPGKRDSFIRQKRVRPKNWGKVLYFEDASAASPVVVVHYDCFVKMDTWYQTPSELVSSIWMKGLKALYDPHGLVNDVLEKSAQIEYIPTAEDVEQWRGKVFAYVHETYRSVMRGELYYAISYLDKFRWMMARGWYMEKDRWADSAWGVWSKLEGERSGLTDWQKELLAAWDCSRSPEQIMKTTASIVPEFMRLHKSLCVNTGLDVRQEWCAKMFEMAL
ncbi:nucleotidyltransferase domain-containing protein [Paenibacillus thermotolerans]|uniref:nucleotidyltransferase domain-containing protein n=1 Tax=Paenibacillus thermotolerans TaxID=3027807 RepID=UPI002367ACB2|nr:MULTISPECIES: nucleotidyltransferase domain-containing protein [unclassified Paenibacillus]